MRLSSLAPLLALAIVAPTACGSNSASLGGPADGGDVFGLDAGGPGSSSGSASGDSGGTGSSSGGCPIYQKECGGTCIPVAQDPKNCGGCGVTCSGGKVCSGGACAGSCLPGLTACGGACVDTQNDSDHCGTCDDACPSGMGCVMGACVPAIGSATGSACSGGGPAVQLGSMTAGCVAQTTFTWAICSCTNITLSSTLTTDGFNSTQGPYAPGGLGGGVGADGSLSTSAAVTVGGALWTGAPTGLPASAPVDVKQDAHIGGPIETSNGPITIDGDAYVNGMITTSGSVNIGGALHVPQGTLLAGNITYKSLVHGPVTPPVPCDCTPKDLLPIASWIAAAKAKNDDASINLDPNVLTAGRVQPTRIDLPCGVYYLSSIATDTAVTIAAHGNTALFIDGDVRASASLAFVVDPTGQFDIVVGGTITTSQELVIGSPSYPALTRAYVGSSFPLAFSANWRVAGNVYAAAGGITFSAPYTMYGALFAGTFSASSDAQIHYDNAVISGGLCPAPTPDAGMPMCSSCKDCGNQACSGGTCGSCTSNDQCCAPLTCEGGQCVGVVIK